MAEDIAVNVINVGFDGADPTGGEITAAITAMVNFYTLDPGAGASPPGNYLSSVVSRNANACSVLAYLTNDLTGVTNFGSPVGQATFTLGNPDGADDYPEEVAVVASYNADLEGVPVSVTDPGPPEVVTRPAQRRKGRLFLGPLNVAAGTEQNGRLRPAAILRTDLCNQFLDLQQELDANTTGYLAVWSQADAATYPVIEGHVDDAWDTQRRRGLDPTTRTSWSA
jgi:hypothetical protein